MMESSYLRLLLTIVALLNLDINDDVRVTAFAPSLLSNFGQSSKCITRFSMVETVEKDGFVDTTAALTSASLSSSTMSGNNLPNLFPTLATPLNKLGFFTPTPIQAASAERALDSENLLMIAATGSGKTLAYLLPALEKVGTQRRQLQQQKVDEADVAPNTILVVAPTRELALQLMRDTTSIVSNLNNNNNVEEINNMSVILAVKGVQQPTTEQLNTATVLIGTPSELHYVLSELRGGQEFIAGDTLLTCVLDEVDVLFPNPPKQLRTSLDNAGNGKNERRGERRKKTNSPQDERRRQEQKRKLMAAKRSGTKFSSSTKQVVGPTESLLKMIASRRQNSAVQVLAGSATASRKTLDRLNKAMYDAAADASSNVDTIWNGTVKACRPDVSPSDNADSEEGKGQPQRQDHTIRAVTVPQQVKHQYIRLEKDSATSPTVVLSAVAKAAAVLKPQRALLFLCGEFQKANKLAPSTGKKMITPPGKRIPSRGTRKKLLTLKQKKIAAAAASRAKNPTTGLSARKACSTLDELGIVSKPLHVALGLETNAKDDDEDAQIPPFLVTFEGSARGLHLDDVDTVFVVGRPSSAASYLHLAGRVGRSSASADGNVFIRPGNVVSFCTKGSAIELNKWTKQVGGSDLEELTL